jgi:hypothetical protein
MAGLIIAQGAASETGVPVVNVTLDTRGATVIYIFSHTTFTGGEPPGGYDNLGNAWFLVADPFSTCNGGMQMLRCFSPVTSATHTFGISGDPAFPCEIIVVAMAPTLSGDLYVLDRARSGQFAPVKPGALTPVVDNYVMISCLEAGCGLTGPAVDSGFTIIEQLGHLAVATFVQPVFGPTIDLGWTGLTPGGIGGSTGGAAVEGFGIFTGVPPVPPLWAPGSRFPTVVQQQIQITPFPIKVGCAQCSRDGKMYAASKMPLMKGD